MTDEKRVFPDEDGNCPVGFHNMAADDDHEMEWCMEGDEHTTEEMYSHDKIREAKLMEHKETRISTDIHFAEVRDEGTEVTTPKVVGYPVVFDSLSTDLGGFREKIERGAFAESLKNKDEVHALFNHDDDKVLGRLGSGTLRLWEDDHGLRMELDPPNTTVGNDVVELLRRGDLVSMSFGFYDVTDSWAMLDGTDVRTIKSARLFDVSIVTNPAYKESSVGVRTATALRSLEAHKAQQVLDTTDFASIGETTKLQFRLRLAEQDQ
jgi:HK97 family phage prohead protease